jgi:hypothetical protein
MLQRYNHIASTQIEPSCPTATPIQLAHIRQYGRLQGWENFICKWGCRRVGSVYQADRRIISPDDSPKGRRTYRTQGFQQPFPKTGLLPEGAYVDVG